MTLHAAHQAAVRARGLLSDLERSNHPADRAQVAAGVGHELDTVIGVLRGELERLSAAAAGNRPGKVRKDASEPSRTAARAVTLQSGTARYQILYMLWLAQSVHSGDDRGGYTDLDLQNRLNLNPSTERPRRGELVDAGLVESIGVQGQAGSDWTVWGITQAGADAIQERIGGPTRVVVPMGEPKLF